MILHLHFHFYFINKYAEESVFYRWHINVIIIYNFIYLLNKNPTGLSDRRCRDRMVVGFTTIYASSAYQYKSCEFESIYWRGVLDTTLCDQVC